MKCRCDGVNVNYAAMGGHAKFADLGVDLDRKLFKMSDRATMKKPKGLRAQRSKEAERSRDSGHEREIDRQRYGRQACKGFG